ncbi:alpha/beta hydrolase [Asanoa sp. WMMD1127]|uniref:alpha/beta hydrolase family protein n=1 Tax=Asanoa sp. WMMD1127 TaxID=3016107 RepID=UPI002415F287|nr:alpha/beta hydrolase [Asanoa sp. WMMD1127]MDG4823068.1 alpha/beta hydrolase [Asanoa sp. WMMD1127]
MVGRRSAFAILALLLLFAISAFVPGVAPGGAAADAPGRYAVGLRILALARGPDRPLPTLVWYPAAARTGAVTRDAAFAEGRFPLVVFSHGLQSRPEDHVQLTTRWAAAGFVVIAPAYPHTKKNAPGYTRADLVNQPADAWAVVQAVSRLDTNPGDPFAGHLDTGDVVAAGHSGGAYTAAAMFQRGHSARLKGAIIIAGARPRFEFGGPPAAMLFIHGDADPTVPYATGRAVYARVPWDKGFITLHGLNHGSYLSPGRSGFNEVMTSTTDFLRWRLDGDKNARCAPGPLRAAFGADRPLCG